MNGQRNKQQADDDAASFDHEWIEYLFFRPYASFVACGKEGCYVVAQVGDDVQKKRIDGYKLK